MVILQVSAMCSAAMLAVIPLAASAEPSQTDSRTPCLYVDFDCERPAAPDVVSGTLAWAALDGALANRDIEAAMAAFTEDAAVADYSGRFASGFGDIRQWLLLHAFQEFHEHVVGTLRVSAGHVNWTDRIVTDDGRLMAVQMAADLRVGKIVRLTGTAPIAPPAPSAADPPQSVDFLTPLLVSLLAPVLALIVLPVLLRYATQPRRSRPRQGA